MCYAVYGILLSTYWSSHEPYSPGMPAWELLNSRLISGVAIWPRTSTDTSALRRVGPFSGAILAALVYEIAFRPEFDGILLHRGPGVGLFPGMAGVEGEEKTGAAGDVLPPNAVSSAGPRRVAVSRPAATARQWRRTSTTPSRRGARCTAAPTCQRLPCAGQGRASSAGQPCHKADPTLSQSTIPCCIMRRSAVTWLAWKLSAVRQGGLPPHASGAGHVTRWAIGCTDGQTCTARASLHFSILFFACGRGCVTSFMVRDPLRWTLDGSTAARRLGVRHRMIAWRGSWPIQGMPVLFTQHGPRRVWYQMFPFHGSTISRIRLTMFQACHTSTGGKGNRMVHGHIVRSCHAFRSAA